MAWQAGGKKFSKLFIMDSIADPAKIYERGWVGIDFAAVLRVRIGPRAAVEMSPARPDFPFMWKDDVLGLVGSGRFLAWWGGL